MIVIMCGTTFLTGCHAAKTDEDYIGQSDAVTLVDVSEAVTTESVDVGEDVTIATIESIDGNNHDDSVVAQEQYGMYVKLERTDVLALKMQYSDKTKEWESKEPLETKDLYFSGNELADIAENENRSVLVRVSAQDAAGNILSDASFMYDISQETLYVMISKDGVCCSTSENPDEGTSVPAVLTLPILDEVNQMIMLGTSGSSMQAVQAAVKLLEWGETTGLGVDEINEAASTWLSQRGDDLSDSLNRLSLIDDAYQKLLGNDARDLLDASGCMDTEISWGNAPVEPVEAIMQVAGLRNNE